MTASHNPVPTAPTFRDPWPDLLRRPSRRGVLALGGLGAVLGVAACTWSGAADGDGIDGTVVTGAVEGDFWGTSSVHTLAVSVDQDAYDAMIQTYQDSEEKEWIEADVAKHPEPVPVRLIEGESVGPPAAR